LLRSTSEGQGSIPKGQVHALVRTALYGPREEIALNSFDEQLKRFETVINNQELWKGIQNMLQKLFPGACHVWPWIHLIELWDYLALEPEIDEMQTEVSHG
jgi:hypothetical protein